MANFLQPLKEKKNKLKTVIELAFQNKLINQEEKLSIENKLDGDILTIGVIGQMKSGKSSFLNALIFNEDILPVAVDTMTAALTVIQYGTNKSIEAIFYSQEEWDEIKSLAGKANNDDLYGSELDIFNAAYELVNRVEANKLDASKLVGTSIKCDDLSKLPEFVGKDGEYSPLIKYVNIYYPDENLIGVRVVDTPGFNDPVISRENLTKKFLNEADVVLLVLFAGMAFNSIDYDILFRQIPQCGLGKILIAVNKYDVLSNRNDVNNVTNYVTEKINQACHETDDETIKLLLEGVVPVPISALMANIGYMSDEEINNGSTHEDYIRLCRIFGVNSKKEILEKSQISILEHKILDLVQEEKGKILLDSIYTNIIAKSSRISSEKSLLLRTQNEIVATFQQDATVLGRKLMNLQHAKENVIERIDNLKEDLKRNISRKNQRYSDELSILVSNYRANVLKTIEDWTYTQSYKVLDSQLSEQSMIFAHTIMTRLQNISNDIENCMKDDVTFFLSDIQSIFCVYLYNANINIDRELRQAIAKIESITGESILIDFMVDGKKTTAKDYIKGTLCGVGFGAVGLAIRRAILHRQYKKELNTIVKAKIAEFDISKITNATSNRVDSICSAIEKIFINDLLEPIISQYNLAFNSHNTAQQKIAECNRTISEAQNVISEQDELINLLKSVGFRVGQLS